MNKTGRSIAAALLALTMVISPVISSAAAAPAVKKTTILLDNYPLAFPIEPVVIQGTTMVPFRAIAEALQIDVVWDSATQTITAKKQRDKQVKEVVLRLNQLTALSDKQPVQLRVAPLSRNGYTLVPLSFFSSQFGAQVSWDGKSQTVAIHSPQEQLYTLGFYATASFSEIHMVPAFDAVAFGWTQIDENGKLAVRGDGFFWPKPAGELTPEMIVQDAAAAETTPYLMAFATDGKGQLTKLLNNAELRQNAIDSLIQLATDNKFQGIALDFEGLGLSGDIKQAQGSYNEFVRLLSEQTRARNLKLTLAVHPPNGAYKGYDYKTLATYADDLIVMAYPYEGEKGPEPLNRIDQAIQQTLKLIPREKVVLGISFGSENAQSVQAKIGLAKRHGLKGVSFWRLGMIGEEARTQINKSISLK